MALLTRLYQHEAEEVDKKVDAGAAWLDQQFPGWHDRVDPVSLNIDSRYNCICGQVFRQDARGMSGFDYAQSELFHDVRWNIKRLVLNEGGDPEDSDDVARALGFLFTGGEDSRLAEERWRHHIRIRTA